MRPIVAAFVLAVFLSLDSCAGILMSTAIHKGQDLTPEQIKAYREIGMDVYGCLMVGGPPPAGNTIWVIVPKGTPVTFSFSDNCHLFQRGPIM